MNWLRGFVYPRLRFCRNMYGTCVVWGSHSDANEDSNLLGYDAVKIGTMSTLQRVIISLDYPENKSSWYLHNGLQSVINQTNLKIVKAHSPKHLVSVYKSTRRHIQEYSNLYFSVGLTPKPKQTRSLLCFVHQCKAVCNATLHITNHMPSIN